MNLLELLKKLKTIGPDAAYSERTKEIILSGKTPLRREFNAWRILLEGLESGSAIALATIILLIIFGGFSLWKIISPYKIAGLDSAGLQAEARDVDIQIQLTNIAYNEPINQGSSLPALNNRTSTKSFAAQSPLEIKKEAEKKAKEIGLLLPASSTITIDQALKELSF